MSTTVSAPLCDGVSASPAGSSSSSSSSTSALTSAASKDAVAPSLLTLWIPNMNEDKKLPITPTLPSITRSFLSQVDVSAFGVSCPSFPCSSSPLSLSLPHNSHLMRATGNNFDRMGNGNKINRDTRTTSFATGRAVSSSPSSFSSWCSTQMTDTSPFGVPRRLLGQSRQELIDFLLCYLEDTSALDQSTRLSSHIEHELWELCSMFNGDVESLIDALLSFDAETRPRDFCDLTPALAMYCEINGNTKSKQSKHTGGIQAPIVDAASSPADSTVNELIPSASLSPHARVMMLFETVALSSPLSSSDMDDLLHVCNGIEGLFTAILCMPLPQTKQLLILQNVNAEQAAIGLVEEHGRVSHVAAGLLIVPSLSVAPASSSIDCSPSLINMSGLSLQSFDQPRLVASESISALELCRQIHTFIQAPDLFLRKELPSKEQPHKAEAAATIDEDLQSLDDSRTIASSTSSIACRFPPSSHISDVQRVLIQSRLVDSQLLSHTLEPVSLSESKIDQLIQAAHGFMPLWSILAYLSQQRNFAPQSFVELEFLIEHHRLHRHSTPSHHTSAGSSNRAAESKERMHEHALRAAMHGGDGQSHFHANDDYEEYKMPEEHVIESSLLNDLVAAVELHEPHEVPEDPSYVLHSPVSFADPYGARRRFTQFELREIASKLRASDLLSSNSHADDENFETLNLHSLSIDSSGIRNVDGKDPYRKLIVALDILAHNGVRAKSLQELRSLVHQHYAHSQPQRHQLPLASQSTCVIL